MNRVRYNVRWATHNIGVFLSQPARSKPPTRGDVIGEFAWLLLLILIAANAERRGQLAWVLAGCVITAILAVAFTFKRKRP